MDKNEKKHIEKKHIEALLFVTKEALTIDQMVHILHEQDKTIDEKVIVRWIIELQSEYKDRGMTIRQVAGGFEMVTSPDCHEAVERILPKEYERLSRAQLETVTIVAYNQPVIRATIGKFRGVKNPDDAIQKVLERGLIEYTEDGYITTDEFLKFFGINDLKELPRSAEPQMPSTETSNEVSDSNEEDNFINDEYIEEIVSGSKDIIETLKNEDEQNIEIEENVKKVSDIVSINIEIDEENLVDLDAEHDYFDESKN